MTDEFVQLCDFCHRAADDPSHSRGGRPHTWHDFRPMRPSFVDADATTDVNEEPDRDSDCATFDVPMPAVEEVKQQTRIDWASPVGTYLVTLEDLAQEVRFSDASDVSEWVWDALMRVNEAFEKAFTDPATGQLTRRLVPPGSDEWIRRQPMVERTEFVDQMVERIEFVDRRRRETMARAVRYIADHVENRTFDGLHELADRIERGEVTP